MYVKNRWYVAALTEELTDKPLGRMVHDEPVVLYRREDGTPVALEDRCLHRQAPLSLGWVEGDNLRCTYHGLLFDCAGRCIEVPGQTAIPPNDGIRQYELREQQGYIFIWMGDESNRDGGASADVEPYDFPWTTKPGWRGLYAQFHAKCNWQLLVDNLLDVSHIAYAHKSTIGAAGVAEGAQARTERDGDKVVVSRWMFDIDPAPTHVAATGYNGKVDRWQRVEFSPPGFIWLKVGIAKAGSGAEKGETDGILLDRHTLHIITPESETSCHYFWTTAHAAACVTPEQEKMIYDQSVLAFNEDLVILEGQQARRDEGRPTIDINADAGAAQARLVLDRLMQGQPAPPE
jgi:phenylpropionate dioxygenase-like ring-hydroxylating dioxygenase large terminal subunit